ncbi:DUF2002 family protein, partial [Escherichia coli]|uniref:DUF2002 family protein n=1 Tax=Escherichia coli TaxID=562 RepID=UPI002552E24F
LRPDEVARVLEKVGFTVDVVTQKAYGYRRGENYVYVVFSMALKRCKSDFSKDCPLT